MGQFPKSEPHVATLADQMIAGFTSGAEIYPAPPVNVAPLTQLWAGSQGPRAAADARTGEIPGGDAAGGSGRGPHLTSAR
jgi:hypothetical protein